MRALVITTLSFNRDTCRCCRSKLEHCDSHYRYIQRQRQDLQNDWRCKELLNDIQMKQKELKIIETELHNSKQT